MPVDEEFDLNQLDTGLPSNFDGVIFDGEFVHDPGYQDGVPLVFRFSVESPDPDVDVQLMKVGTGKAWESEDGGRSAKREDGKKANFHESSGIGLMMKALIDGGANLNDIAKSQGAMPWDVRFWDGLVCHWDRVEHDYGGDIGKKVRLLPVKLLKMGGGKSAGSSAKAAKAPAKKAAAKQETAETGGLNGPTYQALFDLAYNAENYEAFQTAAYDVEEFASDDAVIAAIEDQSEGSIWGTAVAKFNAENG